MSQILWSNGAPMMFTTTIRAWWLPQTPPPAPPASDTNYLLAVNGDRLVDVTGNPLTGV